MAQMKEQNKTPEQELNEMEIIKLLDIRVQNTGDQDAQRTFGNNTREEIKITLSEIKKNIQGTNSGDNETGNQIHNLEHKKGKASNQNSSKKKELKRKQHKKQG